MQIESPQPNVAADLSAGLHWRFWSLVPLVGIATGIAAGLLMRLLRLVEQLAWPGIGENFLDRVRSASDARRLAIVLGAGVIVALLRWRSGRSTGGHGAELTQRIWFDAGRIPVIDTAVRAVVSIVIVAMGASLGREAAAKQSGALLASVAARWSGLAPGHRRLLVACATGAGMGAIYNVPFGGALFALEVLLGTLALPLIPPALATSLIATATSWLLLPNEATYSIARFPLSISLMLWALPAGAAIGCLAALYVKLICWADARKPHATLRRLLAPLVVFMTLGALSLPLPAMLGNGKDVVQLALDGMMPIGALLLLVVLRPVATAFCLGSGAPGGLFTPTMTVGAAFGAIAGAGWERLMPTGTHGAYALLGATAMLAASTQGPVSAIVLTLDLTRRIDPLMVPLMLAVASAVLSAAVLERRSIYSGRIHAGRRRAHAGDHVDTARQASVSAATRYAELLRLLLRARPDARLWVLDEAGNVLGELDGERVRRPRPGDGPLETATAGEFVLEATRGLPVLGPEGAGDRPAQ